MPSLRPQHREHSRELEGHTSPSSSQVYFDNGVFSQPALDLRHDHHTKIFLSDLVSMFISLAVACTYLYNDQQTTTMHATWMDLAGEFMLHAALEQCFEGDNQSSGRLRELFAPEWASMHIVDLEYEQAEKEQDHRVKYNAAYNNRLVQNDIEWANVKAKYADLVSVPAKHIVVFLNVLS